MLKWTSTVACLLLIVAGAVSLQWPWIEVHQRFAWTLGIKHGAIEAQWSDVPMGFDPIAYEVGPRYITWKDSLSRGFAFGDWPMLDKVGSLTWLYVPLWIPFVLIGVPTAWLWRRDVRRRAPGRCACGYDLTGNVSGRCPECGEAV